MERISHRIDWLTITGKGSMDEVDGDRLSSVTAERFAKDRLSYLLQDFQNLEQMKGNGFYPYVFKDTVTHCHIEISDDLPGQGWKFVMSGSVPITDEKRQQILQRAVDAKYKVTRIDLAVDIVNTRITPELLHRQYNLEKHERRPISVDFKKRVKGDTMYLGSRESAYFMRIYDKAKEQGLAEDWIRCELEMKDYAASGYAEGMAYDPVMAVREMRRMLDLPGHRLDAIFSNLLVAMDYPRPKTPHTVGNTEVWFKETVAAAFRTLCKDDYEAATRVIEGLQGYHTEGFVLHMDFLKGLEDAKKGD